MSRIGAVGTLCLVCSACSGTTSEKPPAAALVRVDPEPAGINCAAAGSAIKTGIDQNGDGTLEDTEVMQTIYVCGGASGPSGAAGASGAAALVRLDDEPAGMNCPYGGKRVQTGVDQNGDGTLEDDEVTQTVYLCDQATPPKIWYGDVTLNKPSDLAALSSYAVVVGNLTVASSFGGSLSWSGLTTVTGRITISGTSLTGVLLPAFSWAKSLNISDNPDLTMLSLGTGAAPTMDIDGNANLPLCPVVNLVVAGVKSGVTGSWEFDGNDESVACSADTYCVNTTFPNVSGTVRACLNPLSWSDAETFCESLGGKLATYGSAADWLAFRTGKAAAFPQLGGWTGYSDTTMEGTWVAVDPSAGFVPSTDDTTFWNQSTGEPNGGTSENCAGFYTGESYVNDAVCSNQYGFWCRTP